MADNKPEISIRNATKDDIPFIAGCVLAAVNLYDFRSPSSETATTERVCAMEDTLYSYRNARVACVAGTPVGCILSYDGALYSEARAKTFKSYEEDGHIVPVTEPETGPGEWYLDSMSILPSFRGHDIGKALMRDAIDIARNAGFTRVSLVVEKSKPRLRDYYSTLGFLPEREIQAFGDTYVRMILDIRH